MLLVLHICVGIVSIGFAAVLVFRPAVSMLKITYAGIISTFVSGVALALFNPGALPHLCVSGVMYLAVVLALTGYARHRLAALVLQSN